MPARTILTYAGCVDRSTFPITLPNVELFQNLFENGLNSKFIMKLDGCIVWNAHKTVFGSKRSAMRLSKWACDVRCPKITTNEWPK